jgi:hypothetical protein
MGLGMVYESTSTPLLVGFVRILRGFEGFFRGYKKVTVDFSYGVGRLASRFPGSSQRWRGAVSSGTRAILHMASCLVSIPSPTIPPKFLAVSIPKHCMSVILDSRDNNHVSVTLLSHPCLDM